MKIPIRLYIFIFSFVLTTGFPSPCFASFSNMLESFTHTLRQLFTIPKLVQRDLPFEQIVNREARIYNLDPCLLHAIIIHESSYQSDAVSDSGARGLMQLMPETARELGINNSFDPQENVAGGAQYYRKLLNEFGDHYTALLAYNSGPGTVRKGKRYKESERYAKKVISTWNQLYQEVYNKQSTTGG